MTRARHRLASSGRDSVSTSSPPSSKRSRNAGFFGPFAPDARWRIRPALIRWIRSCSSPSSVGKSSHLPRRWAPSSRRPSSSRSGGSNVFSVAMCAGPACRTADADTSGASSRTHASTSGSSGMPRTVSRRGPQSAAGGGAPPARARARPPLRPRTGAASSTGSGASRSLGTGESRIGRNVSRAPSAADPERRPQAEPRPQRAAEQRSDGHRAPDHEADHGVHPALHALGADRLPEADLRDVVGHRREAAESGRDDEERNGVALRRQRNRQHRGEKTTDDREDRRADAEPAGDPVRRERGRPDGPMFPSENASPIAAADMSSSRTA